MDVDEEQDTLFLYFSRALKSRDYGPSFHLHPSDDMVFLTEGECLLKWSLYFTHLKKQFR